MLVNRRKDMGVTLLKDEGKKMKDKVGKRAHGSGQRREHDRPREKDRVRITDQGHERAHGSCSHSWRNLHVLIILKTSK